MTKEPTLNKRKTAKYYIHSFIGLAFMFLFQFIPAVEPITEAGMGMLGALIGLIWLIVTVDFVWPAFAAMLAYSFHASSVYPDGASGAGIDDAVMRSIGNSICMLMISLLLVSLVLEKTGILRRMMLWFITRKIAKKGPWAFTFMFMLVSFIVAILMDATPALITTMLCAHELFKAFGFKKGEAWPKMIIASCGFVVSLGFGASPIGHNLALFVLGLVAGQTGEPANIMAYMAIGIPVGLIILVLTFLYFKICIKPDTEKLNDFDYDIIEKMRPGKMSGVEKFVSIFCIFILAWWIAPGFLNIVAPDAAVTVMLNDMTALWPVMAAVVVFSIVHVEGKPLLDLSKDLSKIDWTPTFLFAGIILIALTLGEDSTGIPQWVDVHIMPLFSGLSPFVSVFIIGAVCVILTNLINNWVVGTLFTALAATLSMQMGINSATIAVLVGLAVNCAFTSPAAFAPLAFCVTDEYCDAGYMMKHGIAVMIISAICVGLLVFPLGSVICL